MCAFSNRHFEEAITGQKTQNGRGSSGNQPVGASAFGGCRKLLEHYRFIGAALLSFEQNLFGLGFFGTFGPSQSQVKAFSTGVAFVPVEVLESYLDDLLDLTVTDERLFVKRQQSSWRAAIIGMLCLFTMWQAVRSGVSEMGWHFPLLLLVMFGAGLASAMLILPRTKIVRRFSFATIVSREIALRRGHDDRGAGSYTPQFILSELWGRPSETGQAAAYGAHAARIRIH